MKTRIFLDTNILVRFLIKDDEKKWRDCVELFEKIKKGKIIPYCSQVVFLEVFFVLTSVYGNNKKMVAKDLKEFLKLRNLVMVKDYDMGKALTLVIKNNIKFADCLISTQLGKGVVLCSYDREFEKIKEIKLFLPEEIV